jgi:hypothetical protein
MTLDEAKAVLGVPCDSEAGLEFNLGRCQETTWEPGQRIARLFGHYDADELEALAVFMREWRPA